jgi:transposase
VPRTKSSYTEEFKQEVLAYHASAGCTLHATAVHFAITANSLRAWRRRAAGPLGARPPGVAAENPQAELVRLRRENRELQLRCEILKKTVGIFSGPSGNDLPSLKP